MSTKKAPPPNFHVVKYDSSGLAMAMAMATALWTNAISVHLKLATG